MLRVAVVVIVALLLAGCVSSDERQWMKIKTEYTAAEFRRDLAECSENGELNDDCMRGRGWVALTPRAEKPKEFDPREHSPRDNRFR